MSPQIRKVWTYTKSLFKSDRSIDAMTKRARLYFVAGGGRHGLTGLTLLLLPWMYSGAAFVPIFNMLSVLTWGWIMFITGLICNFAAVNKNGDLARIGIVFSAMITAVMALGLWVGISIVWFKWFDEVGPDAFWTLVWDRPSTYPELLKTISNIIPPSPFLPIVMTALVIKDFAMCAQPLRVPLEERVGVIRPIVA